MAASRTPLVRLGHVQREIDDLTRALEGVDYQTFSETYVLRRTTEHAILIISEAVKALSPDVTDRHVGVDWRAVRDIGMFFATTISPSIRGCPGASSACACPS